MRVSEEVSARGSRTKWLVAWAVWSAMQTALVAQGVPAPGSPGPTNPTPPATTNPLAHPGATIVINPTIDQCNAGWSPSLRWTAEQFAQFCVEMRSSK